MKTENETFKMKNENETYPSEEGGLIVIPIEEVVAEAIDQTLVKENITDAVINNLKEKYLPLKLADLNDREGYEAIVEGRKDCKRIRVFAEKICEKGRENAVIEQKAWLKKQKEIADKIKEVELYLQKQEDEYEDNQNKIKQEKIRVENARFITRSGELVKMGAAFDGTNYVLEDVEIEMLLIKGADEEVYQGKILPRYKAIFDRREEVRIKEELRIKEEQEKLKSQLDELDRKQKEQEQKEQELKKRQDEFDKKELEMKNKIRDERTSKLKSFGLSFNQAEFYLQGSDEIFLSIKEIYDLTEEEFNDLSTWVQTDIARIKEEQQQKENLRIQQEATLKTRKSMLALVGITLVPTTKEGGLNIGELSEEEWDKFFKEKQALYNKGVNELAEKQRKQKEDADKLKKEQEMEKEKDKTKWLDILKQIDAITIHEMKSGPYRTKVSILKEKIEEIKEL